MSEEDESRFVAAVRELVLGEGIRTHLKHLGIQVLGSVAATEATAALMVEFMGEPRLRPLVLHLVATRHPAHAAEAWQQPWLRQFWISKEPSERELARRFLTYAIDVSPEVIVEAHDLLIEHRPLLAENALADLLHWSRPERESDTLFARRLTLIRQGFVRERIDLRRLAREAPGRLPSLLAADLDRLIDHSGWASNLSLIWHAEDLSSVREVACERPGEFVAAILPRFERLRVQLYLQNRRPHALNCDLSATFEHVRLLHAELLQAALSSMATKTPLLFLTGVGHLRRVSWRFLNRMIVTAYAALPESHADDAIEFLLHNPENLTCGSDEFVPARWLPARHVLASHAAHCSDDLFHRLEDSLSGWRDALETNAFRVWMRQPGRTPQTNPLQMTTYVMLSALPTARLSESVQRRVRTLREQFGDPAESDRITEDEEAGTRVHSPLRDRDVADLPDGAWEQIIVGASNPDRRGEESWDADTQTQTDSSPQTLAGDLRLACEGRPLRLMQIVDRLLRTGSHPVHIRFVRTALNAVTHSGCHFDADDLEFVVAFSERALATEDDDVCIGIAWLLFHVIPLPPPAAVLSVVGRLSRHPSPQSRELIYSNESIEDCSIRALMEHTQLSVRAVTAKACGRLLSSRPESLESLRPIVEDLLDDNHPAVRLAALDCVIAVAEHDSKLGAKWFCRGVKDDLRLAASPPARRLYNVLFQREPDAVESTVRQMLAAFPSDEVATFAAEQVVARHILDGLFRTNLETVYSGPVAFRIGAVRAAAALSTHSAARQEAVELLFRFVDDASWEVLSEVGRLFINAERTGVALTSEIVQRVVESAAFFANLTKCLGYLRRHPGVAANCTEPVFAAADKLISDRESEQPLLDGSVRARATEEVTALLFRVYGDGDSAVRSRCLDTWDRLIGLDPFAAGSVLRELDHGGANGRL